MESIEPKVYTVSTVNRYIKMVFEKDNFLNTINIIGEISNFKLHYSGHLYFNLKDDNANIKCVMFKGNAAYLKFNIKDGMKVIVSGSISSYERDGVYQVYVTNIFEVGTGELHKKYEQLKLKLEKEGLFDESHKKKIPFLPNRVGVITSSTGAVIKDIINVSTRRFVKVNLVLYPASVQGVNTATSVIEGIQTFNELNNVDVIIIARGGGSFEDLFGFNDENLAYEIYNSKIPIISAVGHETDFTICDFVSDLRAPTPSAAAELVYPNYSDLIYKINSLSVSLEDKIKRNIEKKRKYIELLEASKIDKRPIELINKNRLLIDNYISNIEANMKTKYQKNEMELNRLIDLLDSLSPLKTLTRGYSVVSNEENKIIKSVKDVSKEEKITITLSDGQVFAIVE